MIHKVIWMLIKAFRVNLKKLPHTPPLKTEIPKCNCSFNVVEKIIFYVVVSLKVTAKRWKEEFRKVKANFANYCQSILQKENEETLRKQAAESFEADAKKWKKEVDHLRHESHVQRMELALLRETFKSIPQLNGN